MIKACTHVQAFFYGINQKLILIDLIPISNKIALEHLLQSYFDVTLLTYFFNSFSFSNLQQIKFLI
jgi:hypothetical protein